MQIAVLAAADSWYLRDLQRAVHGDLQIIPASFPHLVARLGEVAGPPLSMEQLDVLAADAVLVRTMPPGSLEQVVFRMNVLAQLEQRGTLVVNPPRALEIAVDKYLALAHLARAGLLVPATITCQTWKDAMQAFLDLGGDVVVKPLFGSEGRGITRVSDESLALRAFKMLEQFGAVIYLQQYIPHNGFDLRCLVIDQQVLAMRRSNPDDWRTNVSRGAVTEPYAADEALQQLARRAAAAVATPLAGVDLLPGQDGQLYVLEVNAVPGWKALARTLDIDVARLVLDYLQSAAARRSGQDSAAPAAHR